jgi:hypothetical protein
MRAHRLVLPLVLSVALIALGGLAFGGERIEFKNGHRLVVESSRVEGDTIYLTLPDGSEVGFPKELVVEVDEGHAADGRRDAPGYSPRSIPGSELGGVRRAVRASNFRVRSGSIPIDPGQRITVGYTRRGAVSLSELSRDASVSVGGQKRMTVADQVRQSQKQGVQTDLQVRTVGEPGDAEGGRRGLK